MPINHLLFFSAVRSTRICFLRTILSSTPWMSTISGTCSSKTKRNRTCSRSAYAAMKASIDSISLYAHRARVPEPCLQCLASVLRRHLQPGIWWPHSRVSEVMHVHICCNALRFEGRRMVGTALHVWSSSWMGVLKRRE